MILRAQLHRRIDAAQGKIPCDIILKNVRFLDVFQLKWRLGDISILDGTIVAVESGLRAARVVDLKGKTVVPGFIDAHVHVESSLVVPQIFEETVLPRGTTTAICDPHELANVQGVSGIEYFLDEAEHTRMDLRVMLSSCVPATSFETNGGGTLTAAHLTPLRNRLKALGLAEMMNFPGLLAGDPDVLQKLEAFSDGVIDGHCPYLRGKELSAYAAAGISSCHESTRRDEAEEKISKGIAAWIREGSVAKDLAELITLLNAGSSPFIGFCTDDRNPLDIEEEGHMDHLVRSAIRHGVAPEVAYRSASLSVARHYRMWDKGAIAPGYIADLVVLDDEKTVAVRDVFRAGIPASEVKVASRGSKSWPNSMNFTPPAAEAFRGVQGRVHVVRLIPGQIVTDREVASASDPGVARISVVERYGRSSPPMNAYARGFGEQFKGAIASSVGHDSHNVCVVGSNEKEMEAAVKVVHSMGGGFCVVQNGEVRASLALPCGGLMTTASSREVVAGLKALRAAGKSVGCELNEPFLQLAFLCLPVIPKLKLTDKGLFDVEKFQIIGVSAA